MGIRAIIVDTAGTTTDHAFIHDVLFPYSIEAMPEFLQQHQQDVLVDNCICDTREMALEEDASLPRVAEILQQWVREDRKATPLKTLQGLIWKEGYSKSAFKGHIFPDFIDAAARFKARGIRLYSFSSASVEAQKLLFGHSDGGDLTELFNGHFDTRTGGKLDKQAYSNIINTISMAPKQVLFVSDLADELKAAQAAGMQTCQMLRDPAVSSGSFRHIRSFNDLQLD
ncbi:acireductone synthase [Shewanella sp. C32]|uniref:Enolase-phosphatase E1 n=1 Tax=Shewanella electrica TaxID=515560 RepID=A0ABT2FLN0_9GAMM|nr:acireductone synthase [Shewanella electrica]MCH1925867.1 acireductone synthase [Shewanella electrica]MCS4557248.1 acireductone synthase [Shewanella electrica]